MAVFSFAIILLCFLLLHVRGLLGEQHTITVTTDPPSGPFLIENHIDFTCHVSPLPPEPVTYSWHAMTDADGPNTLSGQNTIHYTPSYRDLHFSWFFCKVFSNEGLIGVGRRLVEIHGFVFSVEPLFRTFILGSTLELQVNISSNYRARRIETLVWYHNETEVQISGRVSVLNNGRRIIIRDATHTDAGYYRVEIASLDFDDHPVCDSLWLPLISNYAAHAPVIFTVKLINESPSTQCYANEYPYMENTPLQYYPLLNSDSNTLFAISHDTKLSSSWTLNITDNVIKSGYLSSSLSVNGSRLASDASKFNVSQTAKENGVLTQAINFRYNFSDEGIYVHSLYFSESYDLYDILRDQGYSCRDHYSYTSWLGYLVLYPPSFVVLPFILTMYKPPTHVNISSVYFAESGLTQLVCTATGGVPDSHNITLFHSNNDQKLATSTGNELQYYIDVYNVFGEFICTIESLYGTKQVSLLLYEKASFQLLLAVNKRMVCTRLKVNRSSLIEDIRSLFKSVCDSSVDLEQVSVDCLTTGNMLLSGTAIYSNSEGNITASTLIDMLQVWLLTSTDPTITLQHQTFKLITQCPTRLTSATVDVCHYLIQKPEVATLANESAAIGGSFIGGVLTGILACLVTLCIGLCVLKLKADMSMRKAESTSETSQTFKEEEVTIDTNEAYETVEMRYRYTASRSQPPVAIRLQEQNTTETEEPVYENH